MKVVQAILATLLGVASLQARNKTPPPLTECLTKGDLWLHEGVPGTKKLAIPDLYSRGQFIKECIEAYPRNDSHMREWKMFDRTYVEEIGLRAVSFITRHNLKDKFMQEDAAGMR